MGDLRLHHEAELRSEAERFEAELETLKQEVAHAFEAFSDGTITAEGLLVCFRIPSVVCRVVSLDFIRLGAHSKPACRARCLTWAWRLS